MIDQDESLAFLYRLTNGSTKRSFAHYVARIAELEEDVVKRGLLVIKHDYTIYRIIRIYL